MHYHDRENPAPPAQNGQQWHYRASYQDPHSLRYDPVPEKKPPAKKRVLPKVLGATALVLACAVAGFGGSWAAFQQASDGSTVIHQSVRGDQNEAVGILSAEERTVSEIAQTSGQSVVSIVTENMVTDVFAGERVVSGAGSGVVLSEDGTIVTNNHVVEGAKSVQVVLQDGSEYKASVVGTDSATDVAVLKIEAEGLVPAVVGDAEELEVGEFCLAIGNPMGTLGGTVTEGIISAMNREITIGGTPMSLLQMSAPVSPGNSGGGLFNAKGELIGIVNAKSGGEQAEGLGFAIPANTAVEVVEELLVNGYVTGRPALGVSAVAIASAEEAAYAGVSEPGLYITEVVADGAAEKAGLQAGDRIVSLDGTEVNTLAELSAVLEECSPGDEMTLVAVRGGDQMEVDLTLQERGK